MEITSKHTELDEVDRAVLKLEMEKLSLKNDTAPSSKEHLMKLEHDLVVLKQKQGELNNQWENEKSLMNRVRSIKGEIDRVNLEMEAAERVYNLKRAAELKYGTLIVLQCQLEESEKNLTDYRISGKKSINLVVMAHISTGEGPGAGYNINVPWNHRSCGDADYLAVWDYILIPVANEFNPDMILISAGFDAVSHRLDEWIKLDQLDLNSVETDVDEKVEDKDC